MTIIVSHNYLADHTNFLLKYANNYLVHTKLVCERAADYVLKSMVLILDQVIQLSLSDLAIIVSKKHVLVGINISPNAFLL